MHHEKEIATGIEQIMMICVRSSVRCSNACKLDHSLYSLRNNYPLKHVNWIINHTDYLISSKSQSYFRQYSSALSHKTSDDSISENWKVRFWERLRSVPANARITVKHILVGDIHAVHETGVRGGKAKFLPTCPEQRHSSETGQAEAISTVSQTLTARRALHFLLDLRPEVWNGEEEGR